MEKRRCHQSNTFLVRSLLPFHFVSESKDSYINGVRSGKVKTWPPLMKYELRIREETERSVSLEEASYVTSPNDDLLHSYSTLTNSRVELCVLVTSQNMASKYISSNYDQVYPPSSRLTNSSQFRCSIRYSYTKSGQRPQHQHGSLSSWSRCIGLYRLRRRNCSQWYPDASANAPRPRLQYASCSVRYSARPCKEQIKTRSVGERLSFRLGNHIDRSSYSERIAPRW